MDAQLNKIVQTIVDYIHPAKIILFGSRARGNARPDSDYDFVFTHDSDKSKPDVKFGIRRSLRSREFTMDLFVLSSTELDRFKHVANTLQREITENEKVLYGQINHDYISHYSENPGYEIELRCQPSAVDSKPTPFTNRTVNRRGLTAVFEFS